MATKADKPETPSFVQKRWRVEVPRRRPDDAPLNGIDPRLEMRFENGVAYVTSDRDADRARNCGYSVTEAGTFTINPAPEPESAQAQ